MVRDFQEEAMTFRCSIEREVEGILASRFSQSEQLDRKFVCAVTGHGKV